MIPQKLQIKNFLSYGPTLQTVDFLPYNLICLSGKNGHGKSALLDAITWALWGQARKVSGTAKADQGLLRLGQTQMLVIFDFEFNGKIYRIRREYMETFGKPISVLEFGMIDALNETFIPLTDKTIRNTQEKIEQTLRLDFDSFSNSAFLRQGSSNEFSKKSPKDRKQILATILGLDQYEIIRKLALEKIKATTAKKNILITLQEKRQQELQSQESLNAQLDLLKNEMKIISQKEHQWNINQKAHANNRTHYDVQEKKFHNLSFQKEQTTKTINAHKDQLRITFSQWRSAHRKKRSLLDIHQLEKEKNHIVDSIINFQQLFQKNLEQKEAILAITQQINTIEHMHKDEIAKKNHALIIEQERLRAEYTNQQQVLTNKKELIKTKNSELQTVAEQLTHHKKTLTEITFKTHDITSLEAHLEKRKAAYHNFVSLGNWISKELNNLSNKKKLVHKDDSSCPLCEQNLSASRRRFLQHSFETQESSLTHKLQRLKKIIPALKEKLIAQHAQLIEKKDYLQKTVSCWAKIEELTHSHTKITQEITDLTHEITDLNTIINNCSQQIALQQNIINAQQENNKTINDNNYRLLIQQKTALESALQENLHTEVNYKQAQEKLKKIEFILAEHQTLYKEISQQENRKDEINKLCLTIKELKKTITGIEKEQSLLGDLKAQLHQLEENELLLEQEHTAIKNSKEKLLHEKGSIENQHQYLKKIKMEFDKEKEEIIALDTITHDYLSIATATGKDGIQALLIEEAIPEIEQEANYLLSRLTNNQAHIFIESLRDLKKGGTKETLDIKISDQIGIRPYEMFSGGEAFRIDFALRIAISKLLARRAGTALQTLIIDEGFGSQDEEGLGHIMDALHKIQDDFSKIIIVSHLPIMKDQFPVQFMIEKGIQGSTIHVIEQG